MLDKIVIEFEEGPTTPVDTTPAETTPAGTTPAETTPAQTTEQPIPNEALDTIDDLIAGWESNCLYKARSEDLPCPTRLPFSSVNTTGFWSSCGQYCALSYSWAKNPNAHRPPRSVTVNSFVSGIGSLDIWVTVRGVLKHIGNIKDSTWTDKTFSLGHIEMDENSVS